MSENDILNIQKEFLDKYKLIEPETFTYKNITYELVFIPSKSEGNVLQNPQLLFRRKDQPKCFIDFELDYEPIRSETGEFIRYKNTIFINFFECQFQGKVAGDGLKLFIAFINFINKRVEEFNPDYNFEIESIELFAEPYDPRSGVSYNDNYYLSKLVSYYRRIGFHFVNPEDKKEVYENNSTEAVKMEANFEDLLRKYPKVGGKSKRKGRKGRRKTRKLKSGIYYKQRY